MILGIRWVRSVLVGRPTLNSLNSPRIGIKGMRCLQRSTTSCRMRFGPCSETTSDTAPGYTQDKINNQEKCEESKMWPMCYDAGVRGSALEQCITAEQLQFQHHKAVQFFHHLSEYCELWDRDNPTATGEGSHSKTIRHMLCNSSTARMI